MSLRNVGIVYRKELTESLRDRRTLISTIAVPILMFPMLMVGFSFVALKLVGAARKEVPKIMILGAEDAPEVANVFTKLSEVEVVPVASDYREQISNKKIRAAVELPKNFRAAFDRGESPVVKVYMYDGDLKSSLAANRLEKSLQEYRKETVVQRLASKNLPASFIDPFKISQQNVAPPEKVGGATFGGMIGYMVMLLSMTGAMYPAMDLTAGEKERGTMETILSSPILRTHLVLGKFFLVLTASLTTAGLAVTSMGISFGVLKGILMSQGAGGMNMTISLKSVLAVFIMALPLSVLFSAVLPTIALFAKSYKEAQSYLTPLTFLVVIPAVSSFLPGVELNPRLAIIPILNTSLVCREIVTGTYHWNYIALIFASTCVYAAVALFIAVKMFQREDVLFRT
ncbi:MAG TPA: ABC transporter permease [Candidatus Dormibacteraeota bacterium]|nr:ABC transporter permease [Candidatus Dormibacteraeota bacterium]